jgi:hypothetical protein
MIHRYLPGSSIDQQDRSDPAIDQLNDSRGLDPDHEHILDD